MSEGRQPGFMYWLDIGFFVVSLTLSGCGGAAGPHSNAYCRDGRAYYGDGHPPAGTGCRTVNTGAGRGILW